MKRRSLFSVADHVLVHDLNAIAVRDRVPTAEMLDLIAEVEARKLYAAAGYPSMHEYLLGHLHMSEDVAHKRLRSARAAREFPAVFDAVAEGRVHLSGIALLTRHLSGENAGELLAAATHKTKAAIELLIAERFPKADVATSIRAITAEASCDALGLALGCEDTRNVVPGPYCERDLQLGSGTDPNEAPPVVLPLAAPAVPRSKVAPLSPQRFKCEFTMRQEMRDKLKRAQDLIGGDAAGREIATVLERALDELIAKLEKRRFAATLHPRPRRGTPKGRHIPAEVKRAVSQRDGGRCTFVGDEGLRCCATSSLEFDHIDPVVRGGKSTVNGLRLRCRAHNQYTAEQTFGAGFMHAKRQASRHRAADAKARKHAADTQVSSTPGTWPTYKDEKSPGHDVIPWLLTLGFRADEARRAAALCAAIPDAPLEERVRYALRSLAPRSVRRCLPVQTSPG